MVANPWLFFSFFLSFSYFVCLLLFLFVFFVFHLLFPSSPILEVFLKKHICVCVFKPVHCLLACLCFVLFCFFTKNEKFWSWHSVSPCVAANSCFTQTRFNCSCNQFLEETLRVFLQLHIDWSMHGQAILFLGWNSEGVFCSYTLIDGQTVYCPQLVETEASAHWSTHGQAVILGGNSEGVFAVTHWLMVKLRCP